MGALTSAGSKSKTVIFQSESHKLMIEFVVAAGQTVKRGQPVKLTTDGKITPWAKGDLNVACVGYCSMDGLAGDYVTIYMRAFLVILAINATAGALSTGPVTYQGYDTTHADTRDGLTGYSTFSAPTADTGNTEFNGWALDAAAAQYDLIRVALI
ncbi:MAG TPA: hypothetical protein VFS31_09760 [Chitinophagaceae bacterium]|nr:hypothetical protein [Chitinophagaceae bacterium]